MSRRQHSFDEHNGKQGTAVTSNNVVSSSNNSGSSSTTSTDSSDADAEECEEDNGDDDDEECEEDDGSADDDDEECEEDDSADDEECGKYCRSHRERFTCRKRTRLTSCALSCLMQKKMVMVKMKRIALKKTEVVS